MAQHPVEVILMRQLASQLATPVFLVDPRGTLVFYNEPAERVLGRRFEETGEMPASEWGTLFIPTGDDGKPLPLHELPLVMALTRRVPVQRAFSIQGLDGPWRRIEVCAFPLLGQADVLVGAVAMFWEVPAAP
jgi:PAS domain-containing protein